MSVWVDLLCIWCPHIQSSLQVTSNILVHPAPAFIAFIAWFSLDQWFSNWWATNHQGDQKQGIHSWRECPALNLEGTLPYMIITHVYIAQFNTHSKADSKSLISIIHFSITQLMGTQPIIPSHYSIPTVSHTHSRIFQISISSHLPGMKTVLIYLRYLGQSYHWIHMKANSK